MNYDNPIDSKDADQFNYHPFAQRLAYHLNLPQEAQSLVVGIEAPWGSGKTSFLNLTKLALDSLPSAPVILEYRPWVYSSVDSLILGFCVQLASQLKKTPHYKKISTALVGLSNALKPLELIPATQPFIHVARSGMESSARVLKSAADLSSLDITQAKEKVQSEINNQKRGIVIFIDDVDRLSPDSIRLLFQFIKAVADFKRVAYVISYDPTPVEKALSFNKTLDGKEYLKKFIQLPIRLPRLSRVSFRFYIRRAIDELKSTSNPNLNADEAKDLFVAATCESALKCISTPRDIVRVLNLMQLRLDDCRGEVKIDHLFYFVLLELTYSSVIDFIRSRPWLFADGFVNNAEFGRSDDMGPMLLMRDIKDAEQERDAFFKKLPKALQKPVKGLVDLLFVRDSSSPRSDATTARSFYGLAKLLYGGTSPLAFSVKEAERFLFCLEERSLIIDGKQQCFREWLYFLSSVTGQISDQNVPDSFGIVSLLVGISDDEYKIDSSNRFDNIYRIVSNYVVLLLEHIGGESERAEFLDILICECSNLYVSEHVLVDLADQVGLWRKGVSYPLENCEPSTGVPLLEAKTILDLENKWITKVQEAANAGSLNSHPLLASILHRWGQFSLNNYSEVQKYILTFSVLNDPLPILCHFPFSMSVQGMEKIFSNPDAIIDALNRYDSDYKARTAAREALKQIKNVIISQNAVAGEEDQKKGPNQAIDSI